MSDITDQNTLLILSDRDNIGIAREGLAQGQEVFADGRGIILGDDVPLGHKIAIADISQGDQIIKCGISIGSATADIPCGGHLHLHNVKSDYIPTYTREH